MITSTARDGPPGSLPLPADPAFTCQQQEERHHGSR
jgi:hypothetical protein